MKRKGHLIEEIISRDNMAESVKYVLRGKRGKTYSGRRIRANEEQVIKQLQDEIAAGTYTIRGYDEFIIRENGKERVIQSIRLTDRIALNAIMKVVEKHLNPTFIADSASSIKGRGTHYLFKRMVNDIKRDADGTRYVYKWDFRHYYQSIPQDKLIEVLRRKFKDERLITILTRCICMLPQGISIGLRTSQALGNLYLDYFLDHELKDELGVKHYRRFCDDGVIQCSTLQELTKCVRVVHECAERAGLEIKGNEQVWDIRDRGIDFLGFVYYADGQIKIRKHIKHRFVKRWKRVRSKTRKRRLIGSFYGIAKHAHAQHLFKTLTHISMVDFKEIGFDYATMNGRRLFDVKLYNLSELGEIRISVIDFEENVETKNGIRTLVLFEFEDGKRGKFFVSDELTQALIYAKNNNKLPFSSQLKRLDIGKGRQKILFT